MAKKKRKNAGVVFDPKKQEGSKKVKVSVDDAVDAERPLSPFQGEDWSGDMFEWMIWPITRKEFFDTYWEKKPLHIRRKCPAYYEGVFSKAALLDHLEEGEIRFGENINFMKTGSTGVKRPHNPEESGAATRSFAEEKWQKGVSMQVMHPQQFHNPVAKLVSELESSLSNLWGANAYLTPEKTQALAPHYDDVEVFMLQLEGAKHWRLDSPPESDLDCPLPRTYSKDFLPGDIVTEPLFDGLLEQGDLLYLPRGTVHRGVAHSDAFSHHLTVSCCQRESWCDFLNTALPLAIEEATKMDVGFRTGLPPGYLHFMGKAHTDLGTQEDKRKAFREKFIDLLSKLSEHIDIDEVADHMGSEFVVSRLAPEAEKEGDDLKGPSPATVVETAADLSKSGLFIRWRDPTWQRLVVDVNPENAEIEVILSHCLRNDAAQHMSGRDADEERVGSLRFEEMFFPALRQLFRSRDWVNAVELPDIGPSDQFTLIDLLWDEGLIETKVMKGKKK